jgi:hypothetical protein
MVAQGWLELISKILLPAFRSLSHIFPSYDIRLET